jgi:hypothetical protein
MFSSTCVSGMALMWLPHVVEVDKVMINLLGVYLSYMNFD